MLHGILLSFGIILSILARYCYIESIEDSDDNEFVFALCIDIASAGLIICSLLSYFGVC